MTKEIKVTRRIISLVMCLLMIVSIMPVSVSAAGEKVGGVKAVATKIHNVAGAYMPEFTTLKVLDPSGAVTGYMPVASYLYTDKTASSYVEAYKLKTAPEEGKTYYAYITIPATTGANDVKASLVEIEIEGYDIEFLGASFSGYNVFINYTIRKTARVCGVEAEASGVEYNSSLSGYAPVFTKLESVMSNGSVTGYNAEAGALYKSYTSGTWGEKLTTSPVDGETYYSYINLQNPLGIHYIDEALVDIEINGYDVEFIGAFERDMGFRIQVVYKLTKIARVGGVKAEEGAVWYRTSENAYMAEFEKLTSIGTTGAATGYNAESGALYKSYTSGTWGEKLTTSPVDGETYYSYINLQNPLGIHYIDEALVDIEIDGYDVEFIGAFERDMGFRIQVVYKLTKQYTRVTGLKAVASGVKFNNTAGAFAPVFTTLNALAANGTAQAYTVEGAILYKNNNGVSFSDKLTTAPVSGEKYYSYIRFQNPEGNLDIDKALVDISVTGYEVEYIASYERDMGFSIMVVYSIVHKTHTGGTATCTEKAKCSVCGEAYGSTKSHNLQKVAAVKPTCTEKGAVEHYKCTVCGKLFSDAAGKTAITDTTVKATGHSYEWVVTKPAQVGIAGEQALTCKVCKDVKEKKTIPALEAEYMLGDVDFNKKVDATDARLALRAAVGLEKLSEKAKKAADVDKNSAVNATDARLILRAAVGLEILK